MCHVPPRRKASSSSSGLWWTARRELRTLKGSASDCVWRRSFDSGPEALQVGPASSSARSRRVSTAASSHGEPGSLRGSRGATKTPLGAPTVDRTSEDLPAFRRDSNRLLPRRVVPAVTARRPRLYGTSRVCSSRTHSGRWRVANRGGYGDREFCIDAKSGQGECPQSCQSQVIVANYA